MVAGEPACEQQVRMIERRPRLLGPVPGACAEDVVCDRPGGRHAGSDLVQPRDVRRTLGGISELVLQERPERAVPGVTASCAEPELAHLTRGIPVAAVETDQLVAEGRGRGP